VVEVAEQQGVGDEPGPVTDDDRGLAQPLGQPGDLLDDGRFGDDRLDDLDQLEHRGGVEEVQTDQARGP
jgi:hypothetical protein